MVGWPSEGLTFQKSCTSTILGSRCLCRHHVSSLTLGAMDGVRGAGAGQEGPGGGGCILLAVPSPAPPTYPAGGWSAPGWGSSHSSGQAGASACNASAGCRPWMAGAHRAHAGGSWRAGGSPGEGCGALSLDSCALLGRLNLPCPQPPPPQALRPPATSPGSRWLPHAGAGGAAHTSALCTGLASMTPSATVHSLVVVGLPRGWGPGRAVSGAPASLKAEELWDPLGPGLTPSCTCLWFPFSPRVSIHGVRVSVSLCLSV